MHAGQRGQCPYQSQSAWIQQGRLCLTNFISFYDKVFHLVDEGKTVDVIYLHFRKSFDTCVSQHSLGGTVCAWLRYAMGSLGKKTAWMAKPRVVVN